MSGVEGVRILGEFPLSTFPPDCYPHLPFPPFSSPLLLLHSSDFFPLFPCLSSPLLYPPSPPAPTSLSSYLNI